MREWTGCLGPIGNLQREPGAGQGPTALRLCKAARLPAKDQRPVLSHIQPIHGDGLLRRPSSHPGPHRSSYERTTEEQKLHQVASYQVKDQLRRCRMERLEPLQRHMQPWIQDPFQGLPQPGHQGKTLQQKPAGEARLPGDGHMSSFWLACTLNFEHVSFKYYAI